jgi:phospholipid/cholesterol/gamma-HCH transport system permease protein
MSELSGPAAGAEAAADEAVESADFSATDVHFPGWAVPGGHLLLLAHCLRRLRLLFNPMVRLVFQRQVYFVGVRGLPVITLLAFATGALMVTQATSVLGSGNSYLYVMLVWTLVTEAAPLFVAIVVIGRSATVISTELALMKVRGEMRHLEHMRIDPRDYLALPRIVAFTVSLLAATFFYQVVSVTGGFLVSTLLLHVSFWEQMHLMLAAISPLAFVLAGAKTLLFGLVIGTIACFAGIYAGETINDVPRAQILAYLRSLTWLVIIDLLFAIATFGTFA